MPSRIGELADRIRRATEFLLSERGYTLVAIEQQIGLHKNSVMRIADLRIGWAVMKKQRISNRRKLVEAQEGDRGSDRKPATREWLWNPQIDTFERLERILDIAKAAGFTDDSDKVQIEARTKRRMNGGHRRLTATEVAAIAAMEPV